VWDLVGEDWPPADLEKLAELLNGNRIGPDGGSLVPLPATELQVLWTDLRVRHPNAFGPSLVKQGN
jgi:hypothetical protein